jgi:hypothetical protein
MLFLILILLGTAPFVANFGYWTLTSHPLLELSATSFVYRPFLDLPKHARTISWDEVEWLSASPEARRQGRPARTLTLLFRFTPPRLSAGQATQTFRLTIYLTFLSVSAAKLVDMLNAYHPLHWTSTPGGQRIAMTDR